MIDAVRDMEEALDHPRDVLARLAGAHREEVRATRRRVPGSRREEVAVDALADDGDLRWRKPADGDQVALRRLGDGDDGVRPPAERHLEGKERPVRGIAQIVLTIFQRNRIVDGDDDPTAGERLEGEAAGAAGPVKDIDAMTAQGERQAQLLPRDLRRRGNRKGDAPPARPVIEDRRPVRRIEDEMGGTRLRR